MGQHWIYIPALTRFDSVKKYQVPPENYNLCSGGKGGFSFINATITNEQRCTFKGKKHSTETKNKISSVLRLRYTKEKSHWSGKTHKPESIELMRISSIDKKHSEESKLKIGLANSVHQTGNRNSQFGSIWITNGSENKKIKKIDSIPENWYKGRINKRHAAFV